MPMPSYFVFLKERFEWRAWFNWSRAAVIWAYWFSLQHPMGPFRMTRIQPHGKDVEVTRFQPHGSRRSILIRSLALWAQWHWVSSFAVQSWIYTRKYIHKRMLGPEIVELVDVHCTCTTYVLSLGLNPAYSFFRYMYIYHYFISNH